jgi:hypothetical protein
MLTRKCPHADLYMCTCSPESVHVLNQTVHMLDRKCMDLSLHGFRERERERSKDTCWSVRVHILTWRCAHDRVYVCTCSTESVHVLNWTVHVLNRRCMKFSPQRSQAGQGMHDFLTSKSPMTEGRAREAGPDPACLWYTNGALSSAWLRRSVGRSVIPETMKNSNIRENDFEIHTTCQNQNACATVDVQEDPM